MLTLGQHALWLLAETNGLLMKIIVAICPTSPTCKAPCLILDIVPNPPHNQEVNDRSLALQSQERRLG